MAEVVWRQHPKRVDRWMPRKRFHLTKAQLIAWTRPVLRLLPAYLLTFSQLVGMPSGLSAAYVAARAALGRSIRPDVTGMAAASLILSLSGMQPRWELLLTALFLLIAAPRWLRHRGNAALMACTALSLLPTVILGMMAPTAGQAVRALGCTALAALMAPVFARAMTALLSDRAIAALEERLAVGALALLALAGAGCMRLFGVNLGVAGAAFLTAMTGALLGPGAGALIGMLAGIALSLMALPLALAIALPMGGFLAGILRETEQRPWMALSFGAGAYLPLLLCRATGAGCGAGLLLATLTFVVLPRRFSEDVTALLRRFLPDDLAPGDAYAASALAAWEQTIAAMARSVPSPKDAIEPRTPAWWESRLCEGCPQREDCGVMATDLAAERAESIWQCRTLSEEVWQDAKNDLRGLGCGRLYHLLQSMDALRREDERERRAIRDAEAQSNMLVTHLTALSGAARRFALRSGGGTWWDDAATKRIRHRLDETAAPARLLWARQVQGHVQCAFDLDHITGAREQAADLCTLVQAATGARMEVAAIDGGRVTLHEQPPFAAEVGVAVMEKSGETACGDTVWNGLLADGRYHVTLSDGMGHGERAALISQQTVELLRLCLDAGYTHHQALTAVNGMLLMGGVGERFATADALTCDLWTGEITLDKLGAAPSYLLDGDGLTRLTGDALPLGIIDAVESRTHAMKWHEGMTLILLSDGVEDAFPDQDAIENALLDACEESGVAWAAQAILDAAKDAGDGLRRDDQSAVVLRLTRREE